MRITSRLPALTSFLRRPLARLRAERQRWLRFEAPGWAVSLGFHLIVIAAIATVTFGTRLGEGTLRLTMKPDEDDGLELHHGRMEQLRFEGVAGAVSIGATAEPLEISEPTALPVAFDPTAMALPQIRQESLLDIALGRRDADLATLTEILAKSASSKAKTAAEGVAAARDAAYAAEPARWQAWYDITRGRLLLMSVRYREYLATCQLIARQDGLNPMTNEIQLIAGPQRLSEDSVIKQRVDEGTALLKRCQENHPGTPWALLAEWELENELGVNVIQTANPPPRPIAGVMPFIPSPPPPTISIPRL